MNSLQRIILIDSYMPGVVELKVDAHTNICGINASGKTTLQRLLLVFYGELPSNVVPKTRDSFEKWYLPRASSYVIFEYFNYRNELKQVVLSSSLDKRSVNYRFIDKPYCQSDYVKSKADNLYEFHSAQEIARQLKSARIDCSVQLAVKEYRAIIQNDGNLARSLSNHKEIKHYARQFSLCDPRNSIRHVEKLVRAIHTKNGKMASIKSMVAAILEEDFVQPPALRIKAESVQNWANETLMVEDLNGRRQEIIKLTEIDRQIIDIEQQLSDDHGFFAHAIKQCSKAIDDNSTCMDELKIKKGHIESDWANRLSELNMDISQAKSSYLTGQNELNRIEQRYQEHIDSGIENVQRNLPFLSAWQNDLLGLKKHHEMLTSEHQDIESVYQKRESDILKNKDRESTKTRGILKDQLSARALKADQNHEEIRTEEAKHQKEITELTGRYQQQLNQLNTEIAELTGQLNSMSRTEEEAREADEIDQRIHELDLEKNRLLKAKNKADEARQQASKKRSDLTSAYHEACRNVTLAEDRMDKATILCYPKDGTLLHFLRTEMPGWTETIGKLINPDLLQRKDLKPSLTDESETALGLHIDLNAIDAPAYARNEAYLSEQVKKADEALRLERLSKEEADSLLAKATDDFNRADEAVTVAAGRIITIDRKIETEKQEKDFLRERHVEQLGKRKEVVSSSIKEKSNARDAANRTMNDAIAQAKADFSTHIMELKASHADAINGIDDKIQSSEERLTAIEQEANRLLSEAKQFYNDTLAEKGINEKTIADSKKQIEGKELRINELIHRRQEAIDFNAWKNDVFETQKPQLLKQVAADQGRERSLSLELDDASKQHQKTLRDINAKLNELIDITGQIRNSQKNAERIIQLIKAAAINASKTEFEDIDLRSLDSRANIVEKRTQDLYRQRNQLSSAISKIDALINKSGENKLSEAWERARVDSENGAGDINNHALVVNIENIFNTLLPQLSKNLLDEGRNYGTVIKNYYDVLVDVNNKISSQSSRITRHLEEDLDLDGVSESSVNIISKISKLDYWGDLNNFMTHFEKWRDSGYVEQPSTDYIESIKDVSRILSRNTSDRISIIELLDIEIRLKEGNSHLIIKTDQEMTDSSSQGMAYLILCKFLLAFTRMLKGHAQQVIHWPIDELGTLHVTNIEKIFNACNRNNIVIVGALPNTDMSILKLFSNRYMMNPKTKVLSAMRPTPSLLEQRILEMTATQNNLETVDE